MNNLTATKMVPLPFDAYQVGIVCALHTELAAVRAMLDEEHGNVVQKEDRDHNSYFTGRIHQHNVVIACLPSATDGLAAAASVAKDLTRTFVQLRVGLLVGIGGGVPDLDNGVDIRLGDVVVSQPNAINGGVIQYDKGKWKAGGKFEAKGILTAPPVVLLTALQLIQAEHELEESKIPSYIEDMLSRRPRMKTMGYSSPGVNRDILFTTTYDHLDGQLNCKKCDVTKIVHRPIRQTSQPQIHYGVIASGNQVVKDSTVRDSLRKQYAARCVEMEAAGLMNDFPCLVIRGICDYADTHKNDDWHRYAAATAAAYAKELLSFVSVEQTHSEKLVINTIDVLAGHARDTSEYYRQQNEYSKTQEEHLKRQEEHNKQQDLLYKNNEYTKCHLAFKTCMYQEHKDLNPARAEGTCLWVLEHPKFLNWQKSPHNDLLWISADPGCGKSVLSKALVDENLVIFYPNSTTIQRERKPTSVCYFFFKDKLFQDDLNTALCAILHQLFSNQPRLIEYAVPAWKENGDMIRSEAGKLWSILLDATHDPTCEPTVIVIDALDECNNTDQKRLISLLCSFYLNAKRTGKYGKLKIIVTSRPYEDIQDEFKAVPTSLPSIRLRGEMENDKISREIDIVIRQRVSEMSKKLKLLPETTTRIQQQLLGMQNRTYLWLFLAIGDIYETFQNSLRPDEESIESLPASVSDAYEKILGKVNGKQKLMAKMILLIVVGARRALTIGEIAIALGVVTASTSPQRFTDLKVSKHHVESGIRRWCGLFVFFNHDRVYLIHQTAKEFLLGDNKGDDSTHDRWKHFLNSATVESEMAKILVQYLYFEDFQNSNESLVARIAKMSISQAHSELAESALEFFEFAAKHWVFHVGKAEALIDQRLKEKVWSLYTRQKWCYNQWTTIQKRINKWPSDYPYECLISLAALNGHAEVVRRMLNFQPQDLEGRHAPRITPLAFAVHGGHSNVAQLLIKKGANVDTEARDFFVGGVVHEAAYRGHTEIMVQLLRAGAGKSEHLEKHQMSYCYESVLDAACDGGNLATIKQLLEGVTEGDDESMSLTDKKNDPQEQIRITEGVLCRVAQHDKHCVEMMKLLLDMRQDQVHITERVLERTVRNPNRSVELMHLLLNARGNKIRITESVMVKAIANEASGPDLVNLILQWPKTLDPITEKAFQMAANRPICAVEVMKLLLGVRRDNAACVTERVLLAAARNREMGGSIFAFLLLCPPVKLNVTDAVMTAVIQNKSIGPETTSLLLRKQSTKGVAASTNSPSLAAICFGEVEKLDLLLKHTHGVFLNDKVIHAAACGVDAKRKLDYLFQRYPHLNVDYSMLQAAAQNVEGADSMEYLLEYDSTLVYDHTLLTIAAASFKADDKLAFLLKKEPILHMDNKIIQAAAGSLGGAGALKVLMDQEYGSGSWRSLLNQTHIRAAAASIYSEEKIRLLMDVGRKLVVDEDVLQAKIHALGGQKVANYLRESDFDEISPKTAPEKAFKAPSWLALRDSLPFCLYGEDSLIIDELKLDFLLDGRGSLRFLESRSVVRKGQTSSATTSDLTTSQEQ